MDVLNVSTTTSWWEVYVWISVPIAAVLPIVDTVWWVEVRLNAMLVCFPIILQMEVVFMELLCCVETELLDLLTGSALIVVLLLDM